MSILFDCWCSNMAAILVLVIIGVLTYYKWIFNYWERMGIPYIRPTIPFGTTGNPLTITESFGYTIAQQYKEGKEKGYKHMGLFILIAPLYMPIDIEIVKSIMSKDFNHFTDRGLYYNEEDDPLSGHLFFLEGNKWKRLRAKLTPTFTSGKMKMMFNLITECSNELCKAMSGYSNNGPIDIKDALDRFGIDVICSCAFGINCNSFKNSTSDFNEYGKKIFVSTKWRIFQGFFELTFPRFAKFLRMRVLPSQSTEFFLNIIKQTVEYRKANNVVRKDFLQILIDLMDQRDGLTIKEVAAQALVFFLAGFETSSTTAAFCLFELCLNPDIQQKLRDEIHDVSERHKDVMSYESIHDLTYMDKVINETLRKYPPLAILNRVCTKDYQIPNTDIVLKKGTHVAVPLFGLQNDSNHFPEPDKFDPERFNNENKDKIIPFSYMPFGEGSRICIGLRFGVMQTKIALSVLLKNYNFSLNKKTILPLKFNPMNIITTPVEPFWLDCQKI